VGQHYPCGDNGKGTGCASSAEAQNLNKPLWASEHGTNNYNDGAAAIARSYNRGYIEGKMTAYINWAVIAAWYSTLPHAGEGLMLADEPWSGRYTVGKSIWAVAHTAQFVKPGWQYVDNACGYLKGNGTYVTLKNGTDYSIIAETMDANNSQVIKFKPQGGLSQAVVHVWRTRLNSPDEKDYFVKQQDIRLAEGSFSVTLDSGCIYTFTTTTGQHKGTGIQSPTAMFKLPYADNFASYADDAIPKYFSTLNGAFEIADARNGRKGKCLQQQLTQPPIPWLNKPMEPFTIMGDPQWTNYTVSIDVLLGKSGYTELLGRINQQPMNWRYASARGYHLKVQSSGKWEFYYQSPDPRDSAVNMPPVNKILASGSLKFNGDKWHKLSLSFNDNNIGVFIDKKQLAFVNDDQSKGGQMGLYVDSWRKVQFDNLLIKP
jgi:hypothetical protein